MSEGELAPLLGMVGILLVFNIMAILYFIKQLWKDRDERRHQHMASPLP